MDGLIKFFPSRHFNELYSTFYMRFYFQFSLDFYLQLLNSPQIYCVLYYTTLLISALCFIFWYFCLYPDKTEKKYLLLNVSGLKWAVLAHIALIILFCVYISNTITAQPWRVAYVQNKRKDSMVWIRRRLKDETRIAVRMSEASMKRL